MLNNVLRDASDEPHVVNNILRAFLHESSEVINVLPQLKNGQHAQPHEQRNEGNVLNARLYIVRVSPLQNVAMQ